MALKFAESLKQGSNKFLLETDDPLKFAETRIK